MKKIKILLLTAAMAFFTRISFAGKAATLPNSYDGSAPTARSMAMGEAGTGLRGFNDSFYYNSAMYAYSEGLTKAEITGVLLRQSGASPREVSVFDPSGQGLSSFILIQNTAALVWQALSDCTIKTEYPAGNGTSEIYINSLALAAGQKSEKGYCVGINFAYLYGKIGEAHNLAGQPYSNIASGNGFALDLSFAFPAGNNVFFGFDVKNLAGFMFWDDYNTEQLPLILRAGTGYHLKGFILATDWEKRFYRFGNLQEDFVRLGVEQYINGAVCVRLGLVSDDDFDSKKFRYSYGFAVRLRNYELSAAAQQYKINDEDFRKYMFSFSALVQ